VKNVFSVTGCRKHGDALVCLWYPNSKMAIVKQSNTNKRQ